MQDSEQAMTQHLNPFYFVSNDLARTSEKPGEFFPSASSTLRFLSPMLREFHFLFTTTSSMDIEKENKEVTVLSPTKGLSTSAPEVTNSGSRPKRRLWATMSPVNENQERPLKKLRRTQNFYTPRKDLQEGNVLQGSHSKLVRLNSSPDIGGSPRTRAESLEMRSMSKPMVGSSRKRKHREPSSPRVGVSASPFQKLRTSSSRTLKKIKIPSFSLESEETPGTPKRSMLRTLSSLHSTPRKDIDTFKAVGVLRDRDKTPRAPISEVDVLYSLLPDVAIKQIAPLFSKSDEWVSEISLNAPPPVTLRSTSLRDIPSSKVPESHDREATPSLDEVNKEDIEGVEVTIARSEANHREVLCVPPPSSPPPPLPEAYVDPNVSDAPVSVSAGETGFLSVKRVSLARKDKMDELGNYRTCTTQINPPRSYSQYFKGREHYHFVGIDSGNENPVIISLVVYRNTPDPTSDFTVKCIVRVATGLSNYEVPVEGNFRGRLDKNFIVKRLLSLVDSSIIEGKIRDLRPLKEDEVSNSVEATEEIFVKMEDQEEPQQFKWGVLYVKEGQNKESDMFSNTSWSPEYEEFLDLLGEKVDMDGWQYYAGGLDTKVGRTSTGRYSYYTTYHHYQIMYHVATMLPHRGFDEQQLERKRHLGNDVTVIVFVDRELNSTYQYNPETIKTHFNHVLCVVSPAGKDPVTGKTHYFVDVSRKKEVPAFGPELPPHRYSLSGNNLREFLLCKLVNGELAAYKSKEFVKKFIRTRVALMSNFLR